MNSDDDPSTQNLTLDEAALLASVSKEHLLTFIMVGAMKVPYFVTDDGSYSFPRAAFMLFIARLNKTKE